MVEVEILGQIITSQYGTLNTGDILRTNEAFAKHLVDDCSAAKYCSKVEQKAGEPEAPADEPVAKPGTKKKK